MRRESSELVADSSIVNFRLRLILGWVVFLLTFFEGHAQDGLFIARVSATRIQQHTVVEVRFELRETGGADFVPPSFEPFRVVGGPSMASSTTLINGVMSRSQSWSYSLLAVKPGKFTIGPATVTTERKRISTRPIVLEVVEAENDTKPGVETGKSKPVFLKAEIAPGKFYPGQQIRLDYRLLFRENVQTVGALAEDDYAEFFVQPISYISTEAAYETIEGVTYTSRVIKSLALYPHQSGTYTIDPMVMTVGINAPVPGSFGYFNMQRIQDVQVASQPLSITVHPLPGGAPTTFSGAVGQYQMQVAPVPPTMTTDDALRIRVEWTGNGDARRWDLPVPVADSAFQIYEPRILEDNVLEKDHEVIQVRSVEYQMVVSTPGEYAVYIPFTYFDPKAGQFVRMQSDTFQVTVKPGTGEAPQRIRPGQDQTITVPELMELPVLYIQDAFWRSFPHLVLMGLILSGVCFGSWSTYKRRREKSISPTARKRLLARQDALDRLKAMEEEMEGLPSVAFFERTTEIYYNFLIDRFAIPPADLDATKLSAYLAQANIAVSLKDNALAFFDQCLSVRYGGIPGGYSREEMLRQCRTMIQELDVVPV